MRTRLSAMCTTTRIRAPLRAPISSPHLKASFPGFERVGVQTGHGGAIVKGFKGEKSLFEGLWAYHNRQSSADSAHRMTGTHLPEDSPVSLNLLRGFLGSIEGAGPLIEGIVASVQDEIFSEGRWSESFDYGPDVGTRQSLCVRPFPETFHKTQLFIHLLRRESAQLSLAFGHPDWTQRIAGVLGVPRTVYFHSLIATTPKVTMGSPLLMDLEAILGSLRSLFRAEDLLPPAELARRLADSKDNLTEMQVTDRENRAFTLVFQVTTTQEEYPPKRDGAFVPWKPDPSRPHLLMGDTQLLDTKSLDELRRFGPTYGGIRQPPTEVARSLILTLRPAAKMKGQSENPEGVWFEDTDIKTAEAVSKRLLVS